MSGIEIICCPQCGREFETRESMIQQIDVAQARVMLQNVAERDVVLDQWKAMGFIQDI